MEKQTQIRPAALLPMFFSRRCMARCRTFSWLALSLLVWLTGCSEQQPALKVGTNVWPGYESLYLARQQGFLQRDLVSLVERANATQVLRDFKTGQLDVAALTLDEALTLVAAGMDIRVIALMDFSRGADLLVAKPGIRSVQALKGKTILVEKTAVGAIMLHSALESVGLEPHQVVVQNAPVNQHPSLWQQPDIVAAVTFEPFKSRLQASGARVLFDSSAVPQRIVDVLVVTQAVAKQRPKQLRHLLAAHYQALDYMNRQRDAAANIMAERLQLPPDQVWDSFIGLHIPDLAESRQLLQHSDSLWQQVVMLKQLMLKSGLLSQDIELSPGLFDGRFLPEEQP